MRYCHSSRAGCVCRPELTAHFDKPQLGIAATSDVRSGERKTATDLGLAASNPVDLVWLSGKREVVRLTE
jgi:hypothetical protein